LGVASNNAESSPRRNFPEEGLRKRGFPFGYGSSEATALKKTLVDRDATG